MLLRITIDTFGLRWWIVVMMVVVVVDVKMAVVW